MKRIPVRIWAAGGDGCSGYTAQAANGVRLKWLDENDIARLIGKRALPEFMSGARSDFDASLAVFCEIEAAQKRTARAIIASHSRVFAAAKRS